MVYEVERRKTVYHRGARPPQPRRRSSIRKHRLSGWEKAELGADDSRLCSWLRVGGHRAAHRQRRRALAASPFTCGLDRTVSSRWQEYVQQVLLPCRIGRKRDRVALEEWRLGPGGARPRWNGSRNTLRGRTRR